MKVSAGQCDLTGMETLDGLRERAGHEWRAAEPKAPHRQDATVATQACQHELDRQMCTDFCRSAPLCRRRAVRQDWDRGQRIWHLPQRLKTYALEVAVVPAKIWSVRVVTHALPRSRLRAHQSAVWRGSRRLVRVRSNRKRMPARSRKRVVRPCNGGVRSPTPVIRVGRTSPRRSDRKRARVGCPRPHAHPCGRVGQCCAHARALAPAPKGTERHRKTESGAPAGAAPAGWRRGNGTANGMAAGRGPRSAGETDADLRRPLRARRDSNPKPSDPVSGLADAARRAAMRHDNGAKLAGQSVHLSTVVFSRDLS